MGREPDVSMPPRSSLCLKPVKHINKKRRDKKCTSKKKDKKENDTVKETEECTVQRFKMFRKNEIPDHSKMYETFLQRESHGKLQEYR